MEEDENDQTQDICQKFEHGAEAGVTQFAFCPVLRAGQRFDAVRAALTAQEERQDA